MWVRVVWRKNAKEMQFMSCGISGALGPDLCTEVYGTRKCTAPNFLIYIYDAYLFA